MDRRRPPVFAMQKGASVPLEVSSLVNLSEIPTNNYNDNSLAVPLHTTSNINIQLLMNQQNLNNHKTEIFLEPDVPPPPAVTAAPASAEVVAPASSALASNTNYILYKPSPPALERTLQRSVSNASSEYKTSSGPPSPESPIILPKALLFSKFNKTDSDFDKDSVLMSSSLDDSQDRRSMMSYSTCSSGNGADVDSACSIDEERDGGSCDRAIVVSEGESVILLQMSCHRERTASSSTFTNLAIAIAKACLQYYKKKDAEKSSMNPTQIGQLVLSDRRQVKEHIADVNKDTLHHVSLVRAIGRKVSERQFVGTYIDDPVKTEGKCQMGKAGVVVCLKALNKFAPVSEFSDQICHHIVSSKPEVLGKPEPPKPERVAKKEKKQLKMQSKQLMSQQFLFDPTITVTEAARRSYVEILDFVLVG